MKVNVELLRALAVAVNSLRYNPTIDPYYADFYEQILLDLRDDLARQMSEPPALEPLLGSFANG